MIQNHQKTLEKYQKTPTPNSAPYTYIVRARVHYPTYSVIFSKSKTHFNISLRSSDQL